MRLQDLPWIAWAPPFDTLPPNPELEATIPGFQPAFTSDHFLVNLAAAEAGVGAIVLADIRHRYSRPTRLRPLGLDLGPHAPGSLHLVCARSALDSPRVRAVAQVIADELKRVKVAPPLRRGTSGR